MILELHLIQNFAPSNLNRSDTGSPKDCEFGGVRRARVSSQCFKRAMREFFKETELAPNNLAVRSKRLHELLIEKITKKTKDEGGFENAEFAAEAILSLNGISLVEKGTENEDEQEEVSTDWTSKSEALAFLGKDNLNQIVEFIVNNKAEVGKAAEIFKAYREKKRAAKDYKGKIAGDDKKGLRASVKKALGKELSDSLEEILDGKRAADLALFGRMLADLPKKNVDAASQVAHAISTHKVGVEFDFYTAIDELRPDETAGADMLGTIEFNSACFYRYLNVDVKNLAVNLQDDEDLALATIEAFASAAIEAVPTGKQNSMAAQNPPSLVLAVIRKSGLWSLANAFETPVRAAKEKGLIENSMLALDGYWQNLTDAYGDEQILTKAYFTLSGKDLPNLNGARVKGKTELIAKIREALKTKGA